MNKEEFKDRLKVLRMNKGLTQIEFAKSIGKSEIYRVNNFDGG